MLEKPCCAYPYSVFASNFLYRLSNATGTFDSWQMVSYGDSREAWAASRQARACGP